MITRIWHGRVPLGKATDYERYISATGMADYRATGNRGAWLLRRDEGDTAHLTTMTFWDTRSSIEAFAGRDIAVARNYPEDDQYLVEHEPRVLHFIVVTS